MSPERTPTLAQLWATYRDDSQIPRGGDEERASQVDFYSGAMSLLDAVMDAEPTGPDLAAWIKSLCAEAKTFTAEGMAQQKAGEA